MREIKFRVWDTETKRMATWGMKLDCWIRWLRGEDPKAVVMQFTGLKDKNGKEIYEGDIIKKHDKVFSEYDGVLGVIEWDEDWMTFRIEQKTRTKHCYAFYYPDGPNWLPDDLEVIGNIYENKDLLNEPS